MNKQSMNKQSIDDITPALEKALEAAKADPGVVDTCKTVFGSLASSGSIQTAIDTALRVAAPADDKLRRAGKNAFTSALLSLSTNAASPTSATSAAVTPDSAPAALGKPKGSWHRAGAWLATALSDRADD